jgi:uncharacterized membrane protein
MSERKQVIFLFSITMIIGLSAIALIGYVPRATMQGEAVVESYTVTFHPDGRLHEEYTYKLSSNRFRYLFRVWDDPLTANPVGKPHIQLLEILPPEETIGYFKDHAGEVFLKEPYGSDGKLIESIRVLADRNEVGAYNPGYYEAGSYEISYWFKLHPPLETDKDIAHLNLKLADQHIPYRNVKIVLKDSGNIEKVYPHPPSMKVSKNNNDVVITGSSGNNQLLEVELLLEKESINSLDGFVLEVENVRGKTVDANRVLILQYYVGLALLYGISGLSIMMPFLLVGLYYVYGREKDHTVPRYLSVIPNENRKPWVVNQIFEGTPVDYDDNGFYATLLDLDMRKNIEIKRKNEGGILIEILNRKVHDGYEKKVMDFLNILADENTVDTDKIQVFTEIIKEGDAGIDSFAYRLKLQLNQLTTYADQDISSDFIVRGRMRLVPVLVLTLIIFVVSIISLVTMSFDFKSMISLLIMSFIPLIQSVIAIFFPTTLFGRWKRDLYKEKLEWDAFTKHLDDYSRIREYAPEDILIWGKWLIFGTALGVGDTVAKAMRDLEIDLPAARVYPLMPLYFHPLVVASAPSRGNVSSGFSGGGSFGGGGGFGGGGAGVR